MPTVSDIARALEDWAPPALAQSYDHVGLQVGRPERPVSRVLVALDLTPAVIEEARRERVELIITHHPLLFRPVQAVTPDRLVPAMVLELAESGIACYAIHTNVDAAPGGVSHVLAERLGIEAVRPLDLLPDSLVQLAVHASISPGGSLLEDLRGLGAERVDVRDRLVRMDLPAWRVRAAVKILETAAGRSPLVYDTFALNRRHGETGLGVIGRLGEATNLEQFLGRVCRVLETPAVRFAGDPGMHVRTVAVCGGSGSSLLGKALQEGADALVTADVTYHTYFDVYGPDGRPRIALIDAGHYETEVFTEELLLHRLAAWFPSLSLLRASTPTNPMRVYVAG